MSWLDALGWAGSALLIFSVMQPRVLRLRLFNLLASVILTVFNGILEIWPMVAMNIALAIINLYFLTKLWGERHDAQAFEVVEVFPGDAYLEHVLQVHGSDIARHQPDFDPTLSAPGLRSFLVLHGDETVGVVVLRGEDDGTAQVLLDYVTRRFRDFTPGEFVWRRSQLLTQSGFRKIRTPPGMVAPYYDRLGFRRDGDAYALDL